MDFDKPKVYSDTSITDGLVYSNTNSLKLLCANLRQNSANVTDRNIFRVNFEKNLPEPLLTNSMSEEGKNKIMDVDSCYCDDRPGQSEEQGPASCGCSGSRASFIMKMA